MILDHLHSALTVFPSATFPLALLCEVLGLCMSRRDMRTVVLVLVTAGALGSAAAFASGYVASEGADRFFLVPDEVISVHHTAGWFLLFGAILVCSLWWIATFAREMRTVFEWAARVGLLLVVLLTVYTAYLGGELVQSYGAGVHATEATVREDVGIQDMPALQPESPSPGTE